MTDRVKFRAKVTPRGGFHSTVHLNDEDISSGVSGFVLDAQVGELATVELRLPIVEPAEVEVDEVRVYIPPRTAELLIKLGWTPPEES